MCYLLNILNLFNKFKLAIKLSSKINMTQQKELQKQHLILLTKLNLHKIYKPYY